MKKYWLLSLVIICSRTVAMEYDASDDNRTTKPFKYGSWQNQQWCLVSSEDNQLVASWLQLMLLKESESVLKKFKKTELWQTKNERVKRYMEMLEWSFEKRDPKEKLKAYAVCFAKVKQDQRVIPGFGNMPRVLLRPEMLASKVK
jgi:hypothetical protein